MCCPFWCMLYALGQSTRQRWMQCPCSCMPHAKLPPALKTNEKFILNSFGWKWSANVATAQNSHYYNYNFIFLLLRKVFSVNGEFLHFRISVPFFVWFLVADIVPHMTSTDQPFKLIASTFSLANIYFHIYFNSTTGARPASEKTKKTNFYYEHTHICCFLDWEIRRKKTVNSTSRRRKHHLMYI